MFFLKCKKCDHIDTYDCFTSRAGRDNLPPVCPGCFNDKHNIVEWGSEISCSECVFHAHVAGSCSHPENKSDPDFWNRPQTSCYVSKVTMHNGESYCQLKPLPDTTFADSARR